MATLKLKKKPPPAAAGGERRAPLRPGGAKRPRPTLAQAEADRARRAPGDDAPRSEERRRRPQDEPRRAPVRGAPGRGAAHGVQSRHGDTRYGEPRHGETRRGESRIDRPRGEQTGARPTRPGETRGPGRGAPRPTERGQAPRTERERPRPAERERAPRDAHERSPRGAFERRPESGREPPRRGDRARPPHGDRERPRQRDANHADRGDRRHQGDDRGRPDKAAHRERPRYGDRQAPPGPPRDPGRPGTPRVDRPPAKHGSGPPGTARPGGRARPGEAHAERPHGPTPTTAVPAADAPAPRPLAGEPAMPRLSKRMSELGLASRREADEWIERGYVRVDGVVVDQLGARVRPEQEITIDPAAEREQAERVTVLLHKPVGFVSGQAEDEHLPAFTLVTAANRWAEDRAPREFHPRQLSHLVPAGRLDLDSSGLLVLTQDGRLAKMLIGEDSTVEKEYVVGVRWTAQPESADLRHDFPAEGLERLRHGLWLDGQPLKPAQASWQNERHLRIVLREGRKRQIRRMCEAVGLQVTSLRRIRIGRVTLGELPSGQWRYLGPFERFA